MEENIIIFLLTKSPAKANLLYCNDGRIRDPYYGCFLAASYATEMFTFHGSCLVLSKPLLIYKWFSSTIVPIFDYNHKIYSMCQSQQLLPRPIHYNRLWKHLLLARDRKQVTTKYSLTPAS